MPFLTEQPLLLANLIEAVADTSHGAVVTFTGLVRNHHQGREVVAIDYGAYPEMAELVAGELAATAAQRWSVRVAMAHRTGRLQVGEASVMVVVAGVHRAEAFEASHHLIDQVKVRIPIWKLEYHPDGTSSWVDPTEEQVAR